MLTSGTCRRSQDTTAHAARHIGSSRTHQVTNNSPLHVCVAPVCCCLICLATCSLYCYLQLTLVCCLCYSQAVDYYKLLRARGVNTRLLMYPDAQHSLADKVSQELDIWINTALWLLSRNHSTAHALLDSTHDATAKSVSTTARNIDVSLQ